MFTPPVTSSGGPWGWAIAGATSVLGWLLSRGDDSPDVFRDAARIDQDVKRQGGPSQWVIGNARTQGTVLFEADRLWQRGGDTKAPSTADTQKSLYLYAGRLLTQGEGSVRAMWLDGTIVPLAPGQAPFDSVKSFFSTSAGLTSQITALTNAQKALIPGSRHVSTNLPVDTVLSRADAGALSLWNDIETTVTALLDAQEWRPYNSEGGGDLASGILQSGWTHRKASSTYAPAVRVHYGDGTDADARTTSRILQRAVAKVPGWHATDTAKNITWALVEMRQWKVNLSSGQRLFPFSAGTVPKLDFLVRGDPSLLHANPDHGANPAKVAKWYLTEVCGVDETDLDGFDDAATACARLVTIPAVSRTDAAEPTAQKPITGPMVLELIYGPNLPSTATTAVQDRVLAEWNRREAGAGNARPKYSANGIISSDMSREAVLNALSACMAGDITEIGGTWYCRAGADRAPVAALGEGELLGPINWNPDTRSTEKPNVLSCSIEQDRERGWARSEIPEVSNTANVSRDGRQHQNIGSLPLVNDMLDAQRVLTTLLRRDAYGRRVANGWRVRVPTASSLYATLVPGDFLNITSVDGFTGRMRVTAVSHGLGIVTLSAVECPADVYADHFLLPVTTLDEIAPPKPSGDSGLDMDVAAEWRGAGSTGWKLDLRLEWGRNVQAAEVKVEPTTPQGFTRPAVTAPDNYPPPESDDTTDQFVLVPVTTSVAGPAPSGGGSGGNTVIYPVENSWVTATVSRHSTAPTNSRTQKVTVPLREVDTSFENVIYAQEDDWDFKVTVTGYDATPTKTGGIATMQGNAGDPFVLFVRGPGSRGESKTWNIVRTSNPPDTGDGSTPAFDGQLWAVVEDDG